MKYELEKSIDEHAESGGNFVKPWHAYRAVVGKAVVNEYGFLEVPIIATEATGGQLDKVSSKEGSDNFLKNLGKWAKAVIMSNKHLEEHKGATVVNPETWEGLPVGVVYMPQKTKESNYKDEGKFCEPAYLIDINKVDTFPNNEAKFEAWHEKFWTNNATPENTEQPEDSFGEPSTF